MIVGFRIATYAEAKALGLESLWPSRTDKPAEAAAPDAPSEPETSKARTKTKLEIDFGTCANTAKERGVFREVWYEPMRFKVFGDRWYKPDYLTINWLSLRDMVFWECKGYERAKDIQKLIAAADRYPWFTWVLVKRDKRVWQCRHVTNQGISKRVWCPDWLQ